MEITVEISYYSLTENYIKPVEEFLDILQSQSQATITTGLMSTVIAGNYEVVMKLIYESIKPMMEKHPSVFTLKIANACKACRM